MITNKNKSEIIFQYFKGELDDKTKIAFLKKYEEDETFMKEVDQFKIFKDTFEGLSPESEKRIEEYLASKNSNVNKNTKTFRLSNYRKSISIAASIAAIVAIGVYLIINNNSSQFAVGKRIPIYQSENLGFSDNKEMVNDSILLFVNTKEGLDGFYQFSDTLTLFFKSEAILKNDIFLRTVNENYILTIGKENYSIKRGLDKPKELKIYQE